MEQSPDLFAWLIFICTSLLAAGLTFGVIWQPKPKKEEVIKEQPVMETSKKRTHGFRHLTAHAK